MTLAVLHRPLPSPRAVALFGIIALRAMHPGHAQSPDLPSWTANDGRVIQAKFVRLDGESVVIEKEGQQHVVPFAKLAPASVEQAKKLGGQDQVETKGEGTAEAPAPAPDEVSPSSDDSKKAAPVAWGAKGLRAGNTLLDYDGGVIISTWDETGAGLLKISSANGQIVWSIAPSELGLSFAPKILLGRDNSIYLASGTKETPVGTDIDILCVANDKGTMRWKQRYDGAAKGTDELARPSPLVLDRDGNLVVGVTCGPVRQSGDAWTRSTVFVTCSAVDGRVLRESKPLTGESGSVEAHGIASTEEGHLVFYKNDFVTQKVVRYDSVADKVLWEATQGGDDLGTPSLHVDQNGIVTVPNPNMGGEFRTLSLKPEGDTAWEAKIPELEQMGSHVVVTRTTLAYFVGKNPGGSLLIRAFDRNKGRQAWQKDELLAKEVHSSAGNGSPDLAALVNDKESLCVGWGRTVANEHQPMLAKLSADGEVLWVRQLAKRTVPVWWGMKESLILDAKGDAIFVAERAEPGSTEKKSGIWTVSKFSGSDGKPLWQHARHSKIHDKDMSAESGTVGGGGSAWRVLTDKECNTICIRKIEPAGFLAFKLSSVHGRLMWETQIGKP